MMKRVNKYLIISVLALMVFSCKKKADPSLEDLGYSYYPINEGDYSIFTVTDTTFEGDGVTTISNYQIKEEIHEPITVNDEVRYQVYLYYRNIGDEWNSDPDSVWTEFNSQQRIVRVQNNVRFVPLVFPLELGKSWDGNISDPTSDPQDNYSITQIRRPFAFDNSYYPKTVTVLLVQDKSVINDYLSYEVYADGTGLVYKYDRMYEYQDGSTLYNHPVKGHHLIKKLVEHGRFE